jgi:hypothetical protein
MQELTNEEVVTLARLMRKVELASANNPIAASDMEKFEKGLARLNNAGVAMLELAANNLEGKPLAVTSDDQETIERCRSLAEYLGVCVDEVRFDDGLTRIVVGASFKRFVLNDDGNILDILNRFPAVTACNCETCQGPDRTELHQQIYLRRCVFRTRLSVLSEKVEFLCEPEAHSLADIIYWTIYVSKLDWTIGHLAVQSAVKEAGDASPNALADRISLSPFLDDVEHLLRDLYSDCDQDLMDDLLESIQVIVGQWERARTASSRGFLERLSKRVNTLEHSPTLAPTTPNATAADDNLDPRRA